MRSTFLFATFALSSFAAPVPQTAEPDMEIHGCWRSGSRRGDQFDTRSANPVSMGCKISHPRDIEGDQNVEVTLQKRAIRNEGVSHGAKPKGLDSKREPIYRANSRRHSQDDEDIETGKVNVEERAIRNEGKRSVREKSVSGDIDARTVRPVKNQKRADEDIEARTVRPVKNQKRADEEDDEDEDIEARATKDMSKRSVREKTVSDDGIEERGVVRPGSNGAVCLPGHVSSKCGFNKRTANTDQDLAVAEARDVNQRSAEAEPLSRNHGSYRRSAEAEAEPISRNIGSYRRSAEAEPLSRNHGSYRRSDEGAIDDIATEVEADEQLSERSAKPQLSGRASAGRRDAEAGITRGDLSYRSASAEPAVTHSNQRTGNCHPGLLGSHC